MNFIDVDNFISIFLHKNVELYKSAKKRLAVYSKVNIDALGGRIAEDIRKDIKLIKELEFSENILILYKSKTTALVKNFLKIMKTPINKDALEAIKNADRKKRNILHEYLDAIKMYIPYEIIEKLNVYDENSVEMTINYCENCENTEDFIKEHDILICKVCFSEVIKMAYYNNRSYNVNVSKCNYDRISHFKECLKQYQGKQNTFISPVVYADIEHALVIHGIISSNKNEKNRFKNVKKTHIMYFLKELGYSKHYDDYILIYSNLIGEKLNDISFLENELINDFEQISEKYTLLFNNAYRKNFINIQFILYKLLMKHNYNFDNDDFLTVKSVDKKMERDNICRTIFESLNWEYKDK